MSEAQNGGNVMERLTKLINGVIVYVGTDNPYPTGQIPCEVSPQGVREIMGHLAAYEETERTPEEVTALGKLFDYALEESKTLTEQLALLNRIRDLAKADRDGRVVVLPCKVGDTIYHIGKVRTSHFENDKIIIDDEGRWEIYEMSFALMHFPYIGESDFLTREEAERALEAMKDE